MSRCHLCGVLVVSRWCFGSLKGSAWHCALVVVSLVVPSWCLRWCGGVSAVSMLIQGVRCVLVVSWRHRVGGVQAIVLVVGWLCPSVISLREAEIILEAVVMLTIMVADDDADDEDHDGDSTMMVIVMVMVLVVGGIDDKDEDYASAASWR